MIKIISNGDEWGRVDLVGGELVFYGSTQEDIDGLKDFLETLKKRKRWTNEEMMEILTQYLTGITEAVKL